MYLNLSNLKVLTKPGKEAVSRLIEVSSRLNLKARQRKIYLHVSVSSFLPQIICFHSEMSALQRKSKLRNAWGQ